MLRTLIALIVVLVSSNAFAIDAARIGDEPTLLVYGDSRWDTGVNGNVNSADLWSLFPSNYSIRNHSRAGAQINARGGCVAPAETDFTGQCRNGVDRAVQQNGSCIFTPTTWGGATCIKDLSYDDPASHSQVLVVEYGANDARLVDESDTSGWATALDLYESSMLSLLAEKPPYMQCVLVVTAPIWSDYDLGTLSYTETNRRIDEDIRRVINMAAEVHDCVIADTYTAVINYENQFGTSTMLSTLYDDCTTKGGEQNDGGGTCPDGVHWDLTPVPSEHPVATEITRAVEAALVKRSAYFERTVIRAVDSDSSGTYTDADIEAAFSACTAADPVDGCIIELLPENYTDVIAEVPPEVAEIRGYGPHSILTGPVNPNNNVILLREPRDGGFGTVFRNFTIDGNKQNFANGVANVGTQHNCIEVDDPTTNLLGGGAIYGVTCESVAFEGFRLEQAPAWRVRGNTVRYAGCHDGGTAWTPNGISAALVGCGTWGDNQSDDGTQTGRKTEGVGIEISRNSDNVVVSDNTVEYFTKIGIQAVTSGGDASLYPDDGVIDHNTVEWGLTGIALVQSNGWRVTNNTVSDMEPAWMVGNVGKGFSCADGGAGTLVDGNSFSNLGGSGLEAGCGCTAGGPCGIVVSNNTVDGACSIYTTLAAIQAEADGWSSPNTVGAFTLRNNTVTDSASCSAEATIIGYEPITIE